MLGKANWQLERIREGEDCLGTWTAGFYSSHRPRVSQAGGLSHWPGRWCVEQAGVAAGAQCPDGGTVELGQVPTLMSVQKSSENKSLFLPVGLPCI